MSQNLFCIDRIVSNRFLKILCLPVAGNLFIERNNIFGNLTTSATSATFLATRFVVVVVNVVVFRFISGTLRKKRPNFVRLKIGISRGMK